MRSLLFAALNCFIRDKPRIAATPQIASPSVRPPRNVAFVLIWNSDSEPVQLYASAFGEMKNVFVAIVQKTFGTDRLEMAVGANLSFSILNTGRFDPVNHILQNHNVAQVHYDL